MEEGVSEMFTESGSIDASYTLFWIDLDSASRDHDLVCCVEHLKLNLKSGGGQSAKEHIDHGERTE